MVVNSVILGSSVKIYITHILSIVFALGGTPIPSLALAYKISRALKSNIEEVFIFEEEANKF